MPRATEFQSIHSEGGLLPPDLLRRILDTDASLEGLRPDDYQLAPGERISDATTQAWNRLRRYWTEFRAAAAQLAEDEAGTGLTNEKWTLPLLRELGFGPLPAGAGPTIGDRTFPIARFVGPVPVHLVGCHVSLDRRARSVRGAADASPHALVQEYLNRSPDALWGVLSNGLRLRLLRDHQALSRQSYFEADLEAMFDGELYADFVLLWLVAHHSRVTPREAGRPATCWLERWTEVADEQGTRALGDLRVGVQQAVQTLGAGFTSHPRNTVLREALRTGTLPLADFHAQLLRIVYRLIFLCVAEDRTLDGRPLLHPPDDRDDGALSRERYARHYGIARLREMAARIRGSRHGDLWRQFQVVVRALSGAPDSQAARDALALPVLGSLLWSPESTSAVNDAELQNHDLLEVIRFLTFTRQGTTLRAVDYRNLGAEELGGVYESLLALTPQLSSDGHSFTFAEFAGNERKTSGSYYTPGVLVQSLLDSALDPVVEAAIAGKTGPAAEEALLSLTVCDPAVGSGHFLVGAAHRLARHLSRVRARSAGESEPSPLLYQQALRDVIGRCLYGVDVNPMSAELCRVGLWLEALEPGKPLSFLDHHIRVGNSLLGTTPTILAAGIPDDAFKAIEGDDPKACTALRRRNKVERKGLGPLFAAQEAEQQERLAEAATSLNLLPDDRPEHVRAKADAFREHQETDAFRRRRQLADAWCTAFVVQKAFTEPGRESSARGLTQAHLQRLANGAPLPDGLDEDVTRLGAQYRFFHWHLAFPEVFARGGFDCVLGNPPWERVKIQEKEWFAERSPAIAAAPNAAARTRLIDALATRDPLLYRAFLDALREAEGESHLLRNSGRYPLCGRGDINVYTVFAEGMRAVLNDGGRCGYVVPTGIATDDTTKFFFQNVIESRSLVSLYDFENRGVFFPGVHGSYKFCLFTAGRGTRATADSATFVFFAHRIEDVADPERRFTLAADDIALLNPNTRTCPIFRSRRDAELTKAIYRRVPVLVREARDGQPEENPWGVTFSRMFDMSNDSHLFRTREQLEGEGWTLVGNRFTRQVTTEEGAEREEVYLPLYEAKMTNLFDHRHGSIVGSSNVLELSGVPAVATSLGQHRDPTHLAIPRYWVPEADVQTTLGALGWQRGFLLSTRDVARATDIRTAIHAVVPPVGVGHKAPLVLPFDAMQGQTASFLALLNAFVLDYVTRQKIGGASLSFFIIKQLPVLGSRALASPARWSTDESVHDWLRSRVLELSFTAWDVEASGKDCGWSGPPFQWDEERRVLLRAELDAAAFHLYLPTTPDGDWDPSRDESAAEIEGLVTAFEAPRAAVAYILDTFPIVRRRDEERFGTYRTKELILESYDAMQEAMRTGLPFGTRLDPPPADPRCSHGQPHGGVHA